MYDIREITSDPEWQGIQSDPDQLRKATDSIYTAFINSDNRRAAHYDSLDEATRQQYRQEFDKTLARKYPGKFEPLSGVGETTPQAPLPPNANPDTAGGPPNPAYSSVSPPVAPPVSDPARPSPPNSMAGAAVTSDDGVVARAREFATEAPKTFIRGTIGTGQSLIKAVAGGLESHKIGEGLPGAMGLTVRTAFDKLDRLGKLQSQFGEQAGESAEAIRGFEQWMAKHQNAHFWKASENMEQATYGSRAELRALRVIGESAPPTVAAVMLTARTGNTAAAAALYGATGFGDSYEGARAAGKDIDHAKVVGLVNGAWTAISEKIPFDRMLGRRGQALLTRIAAGAGNEAVQELVQTVGSNIIERVGFDEGRRIFEGWQDAIVAGGVLGGASGAIIGPEGSNPAPPKVDPPAAAPPPLPEVGSDVKESLTTAEESSVDAPAAPEAAPEAPRAPRETPAPTPIVNTIPSEVLAAREGDYETAPARETEQPQEVQDLQKFIRLSGGIRASGNATSENAELYDTLPNTLRANPKSPKPGQDIDTMLQEAIGLDLVPPDTDPTAFIEMASGNAYADQLTQEQEELDREAAAIAALEAQFADDPTSFDPDSFTAADDFDLETIEAEFDARDEAAAAEAEAGTIQQAGRPMEAAGMPAQPGQGAGSPDGAWFYENLTPDGNLQEPGPPPLPKEQADQPAPWAMEMPEMVQLAEHLGQGRFPQIAKVLKIGNMEAAGIFNWKPGEAKGIQLSADVFKLLQTSDRKMLWQQAQQYAAENTPPLNVPEVANPETAKAIEQRHTQQVRDMAKEKYAELYESALTKAKTQNPKFASKVLAHEIGHWIDFLNHKTLKTGSILNRIAGLSKEYRRMMIGMTPETHPAFFGKADQKQFARRARENLTKRGLSRAADPKRYQAAYRAEMQKQRALEAKRRGYLTKQEIIDELMPVMEWWTGQPADQLGYFTAPEEMFAEIFSVFINNPVELMNRAPKFYAAYHARMNERPEMAKIYNDFQNAIKTGEAKQGRRTRLRNAMVEGDTNAFLIHDGRNEKIKREFWDQAVYAVDRTFGPAYRRLRNARKAGQDTTATEKAIQDYRYRAAAHEAYMTDLNNMVIDKLVDNGLEWIDLGEYMFHQHVIHNRFDLANPLGFNALASTEALQEMKEKYGPRQFEAMELAQQEYRRIYEEHVLSVLRASEVLSPELEAEITERVFYATFAAQQRGIDPETHGIDALIRAAGGNAPSGKIYQQVGNLGLVSNPATATTQKALSLIDMAYRENAKRQLMEAMQDPIFAEEIRPAEWVNGKGGREPVRIDDGRLATIEYMHQGELQAYYVPAVLAKMFQAGDPIENQVAAKIIYQFTHIPKAAFTQYNPGFWGFQIIRDVFDFARKMPKASIFFGKGAIWRVLPEAYRAANATMRGEYSAHLQDALKRKMLISVGDYQGMNREDAAFEQLLAKYHQDPRVFDKTLSQDLNLLQRAWRRLEGQGQVFERTVKIAGKLHLDKHFPDMPEQRKQFLVQSRAGSPDFLDKPKMGMFIDYFHMFYNPAKQGWRSEAELFKESPVAYMFGAVKYAVLPKMVQMYMAGVLLDAMKGDDEEEFAYDEEVSDWKRQWGSIPEYDKINYMVFPMGWEDKDAGKVRYFRIPQSETQRLFAGIFYKAATEQPQDIAGSITNYAAGSVPGINPMAKIVNAYGAYKLNGQNPFDNFLQRELFTRDEWDARKTSYDDEIKFAKWSFNQMFGGLVKRADTDPTRARADKTDLEKFVNLPLIQPTIGRYLRVSNRGIFDAFRGTKEQYSEDKAVVRRQLEKDMFAGTVGNDPAAPYTRRQEENAFARESRYNLHPVDQLLEAARSNEERERIEAEARRQGYR